MPTFEPRVSSVDRPSGVRHSYVDSIFPRFSGYSLVTLVFQNDVLRSQKFTLNTIDPNCDLKPFNEALSQIDTTLFSRFVKWTTTHRSIAIGFLLGAIGLIFEVVGLVIALYQTFFDPSITKLKTQVDKLGVIGIQNTSLLIETTQAVNGLRSIVESMFFSQYKSAGEGCIIDDKTPPDVIVSACSKFILRARSKNQISLLAKAYAARCVALMRQRRFAPAISDCTEAINLTPNDPSLFAFRAYVFLSMKNYELAKSDVEKAQALEARSPDTLAASAILQLYPGKYVDARNVGRELDSVAEFDVIGYVVKSVAYLGLGKSGFSVFRGIQSDTALSN